MNGRLTNIPRRVLVTAATVLALLTGVGVVATASPAEASGGVRLIAQHSFQCMDVLGFNSSDGATIGQWSCNYAINQAWYVDWTTFPGKFRVQSQFSGKCMDVAQADTTPGTRIMQYTCHGGLNQQFVPEFIGYSPGGYPVYTAHLALDYNRCADVLGATGNRGDTLGVWDCNGAANQQFIMQPLN